MSPLRELLRENYRFRDLQQKTDNNSFVIVRHDVDYSLEAALRMAEFEAERGVRSTYFILVSSQYYNLFDVKYVSFPKKLTALGHEVGLHYDVQSLEGLRHAGQKEHAELHLQADIMSVLVGTEVKSISMHNPSLFGTDPYSNADFVNAYDRKYINEIAYFSDSCGAWRDEFVACVEYGVFPDKIQLLIHPIFWQEKSKSRWETLEGFYEETVDRFCKYREQTRGLWESHSGVFEHDKRLR